MWDRKKTNFGILVLKHVGAGSVFEEYKAILLLLCRRGAHIHKILIPGARGQGNTVRENPQGLYTNGEEVTSQQS